MGPTLSPETSAFKLQTPGKFPEEYKLHSEHGESLKTTIKSAIEHNGHTVINVHNIKQRTNIPLLLYFVDLKPNENNKDIYQIETLSYTKMRFEPPRPKRNIPQCGKCQRYGHTQAYCYHSPRCVKCAGNHSTKHCPRKEKSEHVKCVLCNGNHPANYKGCTVYKEKLKRTFPPLRSKLEGKPLAAQPQSYTRPGTSYSAALTSQQQQYETATSSIQQIPTQQQQTTHKQMKYMN